MISQVKNIFLAAKDIDKSSKAFSIFFCKAPSYQGFSSELGIKIHIFDIGNVNISIISPYEDGLWSEDLRRNGEGLFGLDFISDDIARDHKNLKLSRVLVGEKNMFTFQGNDKSITRLNLFGLDENLVTNLNITISDNSHIFPKEEKGEGYENITSVNQVVILTKDSNKMLNLFEKDLGIRLALDKTFKEWSGRMLFFRLKGVTLEVIEGEDFVGKCNYYGLGWHTDNFIKSYENLVKKGFIFSKIRKGRKVGTLVATLNEPPLGIPTILIGQDGGVS